MVASIVLLLNICIVNAHIIQSESPLQTTNLTQKEFGIEPARELMSSYNSRKHRKGTKLKWSFFPCIQQQSLSRQTREASTVPGLQCFRSAMSLFVMLQAMQRKAADTSLCCTML